MQLGERRVTVAKEAQLPLLNVGYHAVDARSADYYVFQIIDNLLTTGQSSRLYQSIVDKQQLAVSVNTGLQATFDPSLFEVEAQPRKGVTAEAVERAIYADIDKLAAEGPGERELQKAKNQAIAGYYRRAAVE